MREGSSGLVRSSSNPDISRTSEDFEKQQRLQRLDAAALMKDLLKNTQEQSAPPAPKPVPEETAGAVGGATEQEEEWLRPPIRETSRTFEEFVDADDDDCIYGEIPAIDEDAAAELSRAVAATAASLPVESDFLRRQKEKMESDLL